jgi:hypothetical protein
MKTQSTAILANAIIRNSAYSETEIRVDYKTGKSECWRRGFFAARGINWLQGQIIEQGLKLR